MKFRCPQCGSKLRKSRTKTYKEKVQKALGTRPFRCMNKECNWRGLIKIKSFKEIISNSESKYKLLFAITIGIILSYLVYKIFIGFTK